MNKLTTIEAHLEYLLNEWMVIGLRPPASSKDDVVPSGMTIPVSLHTRVSMCLSESCFSQPCPLNPGILCPPPPPHWCKCIVHSQAAFVFSLYLGPLNNQSLHQDHEAKLVQKSRGSVVWKLAIIWFRIWRQFLKPARETATDPSLINTDVAARTSRLQDLPRMSPWPQSLAVCVHTHAHTRTPCDADPDCASVASATRPLGQHFSVWTGPPISVSPNPLFCEFEFFINSRKRAPFPHLHHPEPGINRPLVNDRRICHHVTVNLLRQLG